MCSFFKFLYWLVPVKSFQSFLIKIHFSGCNRCRKETEIDNQLKEIIAVPEWVKAEEIMWPQVKTKVYTSEKKALKTVKKYKFSLFKKWRWATAFIALTILVAISFLIQKGLKREVSSEEALLTKSPPKVIVKRAELKGKKARPIIYQTSTVSIIFLVEDKEPGE